MFTNCSFTLWKGAALGWIYQRTSLTDWDPGSNVSCAGKSVHQMCCLSPHDSRLFAQKSYGVAVVALYAVFVPLVLAWQADYRARYSFLLQVDRAP